MAGTLTLAATVPANTARRRNADISASQLRSFVKQRACPGPIGVGSNDTRYQEMRAATARGHNATTHDGLFSLPECVLVCCRQPKPCGSPRKRFRRRFHSLVDRDGLAVAGVPPSKSSITG